MASHYEDGYNNPVFNSQSPPPRPPAKVSQSSGRYEDIRICQVSASRRPREGYRNAHENHGYDDNSSPPRRLITARSNRYEVIDYEEDNIEQISSPRRIVRAERDKYCYIEDNVISPRISEAGHDNLCYDRHNSPPRRILNGSRNGDDNICFDERTVDRNNSPPRSNTITSYSGHGNLCYGDNISEYDHHTSSPRKKDKFNVSKSIKGHDNECFDNSISSNENQRISDISVDSEGNEFYDNSSVDTVQTARITPRQPPVGAATVATVIDSEFVHQRYESRGSRTPGVHRRHNSVPSPTAPRRLLQEYSPPRKTSQRPDRANMNRRHSVNIPRNKPVLTTVPQSQMITALTSPMQSRRYSRELSPPKTGYNKRPIPEPQFTSSPRKQPQVNQQQNKSRQDSPSNTPQKVKTDSPSRFRRLISPFSTPKKQEPTPSDIPETPVKVGKLISPFSTPQKSDPSSMFITAKKNGASASQRKLMDTSQRSSTLYVMPDGEVGRNTAVVSPSYPERVDSSPRKSSWIQMSSVGYQEPPTGTLTAVGIILVVCGAIAMIIGLYLLSVEGRRYYLDFGLLSGGLYLLLGALAFRARRWQWLPNRNYVSGYIVVSMFSVLTCTGLAVIASMRPQPGTPLADLLGGGVCGVAVLTIFLSALGIVMSQCCRSPPPDNRVEHSVEGFTL